LDSHYNMLDARRVARKLWPKRLMKTMQSTFILLDSL